MFGNMSGRQPNRVTWTYANGAKVCLEDEREMARIFKKMIEALDERDLPAVALAINERRNALLQRRQDAMAARTAPQPVLPALDLTSCMAVEEAPLALDPVPPKKEGAYPAALKSDEDDLVTQKLCVSIQGAFDYASTACYLRYPDLSGPAKDAYVAFAATLLRAVECYDGKGRAFDMFGVYRAALSTYLDDTAGVEGALDDVALERDWNAIRLGLLSKPL